VIFDGNTAEANLIRFEYIISERLFLGLPAGEQAQWHPHNSGELVTPGLPDAVERELMLLPVNSYEKTWRLWHRGRPSGEAVDPLPIGEPMRM
jgi:hypothetical protein